MRRKSINKVTLEHDKNAAAMRLAANGLSLGRAGAGLLLAPIIALGGEYRTTTMAATVAALSAGDMIDGNLARRAAKRLNSATTRFGSWIDQSCDKILTHGLLLGVGTNEYLNGNGWERAYGLGLLAADSFLFYRDIRVTQVRMELEELNKDPKARAWGKIKAALGMATVTLSVSPLAEQAEWKEVVIMGAAGTVALAAYSLHDMKQQRGDISSQLIFLPPLTDEAA